MRPEARDEGTECVAGWVYIYIYICYVPKNGLIKNGHRMGSIYIYVYIYTYIYIYIYIPNPLHFR
jgi:hypothetical protein